MSLCVGCGPAPLTLQSFLSMLGWPGTLRPPVAKDAEPNNDITQAAQVPFDDAGHASLSGTVDPAEDVDVYDLGPMQPGDRVAVEVRAVDGSSLDALAALFDTGLNLVNYNDDEDYAASMFDSVIDHIVHHAADHYYLAVSSSGFAPSSGGYSLEIQVTRDGTVPAPRDQAVLLDFDGAIVNIPGDRTYRISPFDPAGVDARLDGRDDEVKQGIKDVLEDRFSAYDVDFFTTDDIGLPDEGTYSRVVFGGQSGTAFGIAQGIDHYNGDPADEAIIFTDRWTNPFSQTPTVDALLTSIGNVAAHEIGHLLGLEHTADVTGLMDSTGTSDTILVPQIFKLSPLEGTVFPFGWQDAPQLLLDTLGPTDN